MRHRSRSALRPALLLPLAALVASCATDDASAPAISRTPVSASDFADATVSRTPRAATPPPAVPRSRATAGTGDVRVSLERPTPTQTPARTDSRPIARPAGAAPSDEERRFLVDEMVGQINGKPIYADEFFAEMDARLRAEAERLPINEWLKLVADNVAAKLNNDIRDELLLSEFNASLTPEQRVGVLAFIEDLRDRFRRDYGGSSEIANQELQETEGVSLREKVESEAERQFIIAQLRDTIAKRVQVSFKDIELYYNQNLDDFQPPPDAVFRVIRVPLRDEETVGRVESLLAEGRDPAEVAAEFSDWAPDEGNVHRVTLESRSLADTTVWGPAALNEPSQRLRPGEITPRVDLASRAWWVYLDEIDQPEGRSLYEAQLEIEQVLRRARIDEEESRYWRSLFDRSNMTQFDQMVRRLVEYAAERYYVQRIHQEGEVRVEPGSGDAPAPGGPDGTEP